MTERLLTTADAARELGVEERVIRVWKARGKVVPAGLVRGRGRGGLVPLYRLEELRPLAEEYLERAATRRKDTDG